MKKIFLTIATLVFALGMSSCGDSTNNESRVAQELSGAGATFPLPFYNVIFEQFAEKTGDDTVFTISRTAFLTKNSENFR